MAAPQNTSICKSVFKEGSSTTTARFTAKWIEWINRVEKQKALLLQADPKNK